MNERIALLTGAINGALMREIADPASAFTWRSAEPVIEGTDFTNVIVVTAEDGTRFIVTVEQEQP